VRTSLYVVCVYVIINSSIKLFLCYVGHVRFVRYTNMPARLDVLVVRTLRLHVIHSSFLVTGFLSSLVLLLLSQW
jgi:hypothetical protein